MKMYAKVAQCMGAREVVSKSNGNTYTIHTVMFAEQSGDCSIVLDIFSSTLPEQIHDGAEGMLSFDVVAKVSSSGNWYNQVQFKRFEKMAIVDLQAHPQQPVHQPAQQPQQPYAPQGNLPF